MGLLCGQWGKSLLAVDYLSEIHLIVSDIRLSILTQLKNRFKQAGVTNFQMQQLDLEKENGLPGSFLFDLVIADVPCTGSGTWGRTPEQRVFFSPDQLNYYATKQKRILDSLHHSVKLGGYILYCTCSVFQQENEEQVMVFAKKFGFEILKMQLFSGVNHQAGSMFGALLQKVNK